MRRRHQRLLNPPVEAEPTVASIGAEVECGTDLLEWAKKTMTAGERDFFAAFALEASDEELSEAGVLDIAAPFEEWPLHPVSSARALPDVQENCSRAALLRRRR